MASYISEISYDRDPDTDFIEPLVPVGTDVSSNSIVIYDEFGSVIATYSLGSIVSTSGAGDVYLVDSGTPGFTELDGNLGFALVDDLGDVLQFVSVENYVITATEGPADGLTSNMIGESEGSGSLQSDDGGLTYFVQSNPNPGTIPCYGPGTMIDTPDGPRAVETLETGDPAMTLDHGPQPIIWLRQHTQSLDSVPDANRPVLIQAGALGPERPARDLIVSPQHRILVGALGQLDGLGEGQAFAPAKSLTRLPGIRVMRGKRTITWIHFTCAHHEVVFANGCASESLLLGPMVLNALSRHQRRTLNRLFGPQLSSDDGLNGPPARPCLSVGEVRKQLCDLRVPLRAAA